jgi:hypothetical protein
LRQKVKDKIATIFCIEKGQESRGIQNGFTQGAPHPAGL